MPSIDRALADQVLRFQLNEEAFRIAGTDFLVRGGRSARTLIKDGPLRVTLIALAAGEMIAEHHAAGPITVLPLAGRIEFEVGEETHSLEAGDLLSLPKEVRHAVRSQTGGIFLLTVATEGKAAG